MELNQLKAQLTLSLGNIRQALDTFQQSEQVQQRLTASYKRWQKKSKPWKELPSEPCAL